MVAKTIVARFDAQVTPLNQKVAKVSKVVGKMSVDFDKAGLKAELFGKRLDRQAMAARRTTTANARLSRSLARVGAGMAGTGGLIYLVTRRFAEGVKQAYNFDKAITRAARTARLFGQDLNLLRSSLEETSLETGIARDALGRVSGIAGQLGIKGSRTIGRFTERIAKLTRTSNLGEEAAAAYVGRILTLTGDPLLNGLKKLTDAITHLGNNSNATEKQIAEVAVKLAPIGRTFGLTAVDVAALGAAMASAGVQAQAGATAFLRLFQYFAQFKADNAVEQLQLIADVAGKSVMEVRQLIDDDIASLSASFLGGLEARGGAEAGRILNQIGFTALRERKVFQALSNPLAAEKLDLARNKSFDATDIEFQTILEAMYGRLDVSINKINQAFGQFGEFLLRTFLPAVEAFGDEFSRLARSSTGQTSRNLRFARSLSNGTQGGFDGTFGAIFDDIQAGIPRGGGDRNRSAALQEIGNTLVNTFGSLKFADLPGTTIAALDEVLELEEQLHGVNMEMTNYRHGLEIQARRGGVAGFGQASAMQISAMVGSQFGEQRESIRQDFDAAMRELEIEVVQQQLDNLGPSPNTPAGRAAREAEEKRLQARLRTLQEQGGLRDPDEQTLEEIQDAARLQREAAARFALGTHDLMDALRSAGASEGELAFARGLRGLRGEEERTRARQTSGDFTAIEKQKALADIEAKREELVRQRTAERMKEGDQQAADVRASRILQIRLATQENYLNVAAGAERDFFLARQKLIEDAIAAQGLTGAARKLEELRIKNANIELDAAEREYEMREDLREKQSAASLASARRFAAHERTMLGMIRAEASEKEIEYADKKFEVEEEYRKLSLQAAMETDATQKALLEAAIARNRQAAELLKSPEQQRREEIAGAIIDPIVEAMQGNRSLKDAFDGIMMELAHSILEKRIVDPFKKNMEGLILTSLDALFGKVGGGAGGPAGGPIPGGQGLVGSFFASLLGFERGGKALRGGLALVGERGPEVVNMPTGSMVYPNGMMAGGGGRSVVNNFNIQSEDKTAIKRVMQEEMPQIIRNVEASLLNKSQGNSRFARAFGN